MGGDSFRAGITQPIPQQGGPLEGQPSGNFLPLDQALCSQGRGGFYRFGRTKCPGGHGCDTRLLHLSQHRREPPRG